MDPSRMNSYLQQQQAVSRPSSRATTPSRPSRLSHSSGAPPKPAPTTLTTVEDISLEEFKNFVKKWLELDGYIRKAQEIVKEKKKQRNKLSEIITKFMCKYNIEDLNTKEGRIRCKTTYVKAPVTQKEVKERITTMIPQHKEVVRKIYDERPKKEKVSLRRLRIT